MKNKKQLRLIWDDAWKYFRHAPEFYPVCAACGVTVLRIKEAYEVDIQDEDLPITKEGTIVICRDCGKHLVNSDIHVIDIETLKLATNAEERINLREETFAKDKAQRAANYRKERAKKAARTRAENKKTNKVK